MFPLPNLSPLSWERLFLNDPCLVLEKNRWYDYLARIQLPKERYLKSIVMPSIPSVQGQRYGIGCAGHLLQLPSAADGAQMTYLLSL